MVDREVVLSTIRKMLDAGLNDQVITTTLSDVGLTPAEIKSYLGEAKKPVDSRQARASVEPVVSAESSLDSSASSDSDSSVSDSVQNPLAEENELLHETTHLSLAENQEVLQELTDRLSRIESLLAALSKIPVSELNIKIGSLDKKISDNIREIADVKAQTSALLEILEKILETDRNTLLELQKKK
ncbi:MAG: hypothetical protein V1777_01670 [Candidatus Micrarchaeota archaeon]